MAQIAKAHSRLAGPSREVAFQAKTYPLLVRYAKKLTGQKLTQPLHATAVAESTVYSIQRSEALAERRWLLERCWLQG